MDASVSGTINQRKYLKKFRGASAPLSPQDPPMKQDLNQNIGKILT